MPRIHCVTSNGGKAALMRESVVAAGFEAVAVDLPLIEPQASSFEEVALVKARQAFAILGGPLVVEDSGFCVDALSGFPGPFTKYVIETIGAAGILRLADDLPSRDCRFAGALVYVGSDGTTQVFADDRATGTLALNIDDTPCDGAWSVLWRIFVPRSATKPISALSSLERDALWTVWRANSVYAQLAEALRNMVAEPQ